MNQNELYHYGVKGMKWGVRKDRKYGRQLRRYTSPTIENVKSVPIGIALRLAQYTPILGPILTISLVTLGVGQTLNKLDRKDYTKSEGPIENLSELKRKTQHTSIKDDLKKINPRIGIQKGTVNNCVYCTVGLEMRQRGYDVRARKKAQGTMLSQYGEWFEGATIKQNEVKKEPGESRKAYANRSFDTLCKTLETQGEGARGYVGVTWEKTLSGHSMYYKIENGRAIFYDGQSGKVDPDKLFAMADPSKHDYARLDNLKLKEGVTNAVISYGK